jgi:transposase
MKREDLVALSKGELIDIILQLVEVNAALAVRVSQLEDQLNKRPPNGKSTPGWVKSNKPKIDPKPSAKQGHPGFGRKREEPTQRVQHVVNNCPDCGRSLRGGWVKRRRQVVHIPVVAVQVIEHEIIARQCPKCHKEVVPKVDLSGEVVDQRRVSIDTMSMIATLSEEGRVPLRTIQWYLQKLHGLKISLGELVDILHLTAKRGQATVDKLKEEVRGSPVVHGDETGMRENGQNGYIWSFSTPNVRYFEYKHTRSGTVVTEILGDAFEGCLASDFYGGYNRMEGRHQRCWAHLFRDIHGLKEDFPEDTALHRWARRVHRLFRWAKLFQSDDPERRQRAQRVFEGVMSGICQPFVGSQAVQRTLCERVERFLPELFEFVADPRVPADNNAAERSLRTLVIDRKISGGTRSDKGSATKMVLASLFGTWHVRAENPFQSCRDLLLSPRI